MLVITGNKGNTATINVDPEVKFPLTELVDRIIIMVCMITTSLTILLYFKQSYSSETDGVNHITQVVYPDKNGYPPG